MKIFSEVMQDKITAELAGAFDYQFDGKSEFEIPAFELPENFQIGLIVGPSGSGKSSLLSSIGKCETPEWDAGRAVCSHFSDAADARERLGSVGLNSVPAWMKPYSVLSTGEKFRADLARMLRDGAVIDEFTSVVDRSVAKSCAFAVQRYIRSSGFRGVVFATCHYDVAEWLQPDWIFDTSTGRFAGRGEERRPSIELALLPSTSAAWALFRHHHYLSADINKSARCWIAEWDGSPIGFSSVLAFPNGNLKNAWREHRTVVLPEFQGLGLGVRISDAIGEMVMAEGGRYFSKTANYRMGEYRNSSPKWRPTSKNMKARPDYAVNRATKEARYKDRHTSRLCFSHEYIGEINASGGVR
jgi:ABC-type ATPase involved in cell division